MRYAFSVDRIGACALKSFTVVAGENRTTCELLWARKEDLGATCGGRVRRSSGYPARTVYAIRFRGGSLTPRPSDTYGDELLNVNSASVNWSRRIRCASPSAQAILTGAALAHVDTTVARLS